MSRKKSILVNFLLDETGSMQNNAKQTISGFNEYIGALRASEIPTRLTLTKFNSVGVTMPYVNEEIGKILELSEKTYRPAAMTPLYDAVGMTIERVNQTLDKIRTQKKALPNVVCVIMTDGEENDSKEYTREEVFNLVREHEKKGWTFLFMGADQDAWTGASQIGISMGNTLSYAAADTANVFYSMSAATINYSLDLAKGIANTDNFFTSYYDSDASKKDKKVTDDAGNKS